MNATQGQLCSTAGCGKAAAFKTRTKPAWCVTCIDDMVQQAGLRLVDPFTTPNAWLLTVCRACKVQAHYRLEYIRSKNAIGENTCRACFWKAKATKHDAGGPQRADLAARDPQRLSTLVEEHGYKLLAALEARTDDHPVLVECQKCLRRSALRICDIPWGCTCRRNTRSSNPAAPRHHHEKELLKESSAEALEWWDHSSNDEKTFSRITTRSTTVCRWVCPTCSHRFERRVNRMVETPSCPRCTSQQQQARRDELRRLEQTPVAAIPELLTAWADEADPHEVPVAGGWQLRRFRCPAGHNPRVHPLTFLESGCPSCRGAQTAKNKKWLTDTLPEIATQWHPTRNGKLTPENVVWDSKRLVWWRSECCAHEWQETVRARDKYQRLRCPACKSILGSLAWHDPGLAAEWSPANPTTAWHVRPHGTTPFVPEWICATDPSHVWEASVSSRSNGAECPECRESGKSAVELAHHAAAQEVFGEARSGIRVQDEAFTSRKSWTVDIAVETSGRTLVIEYDGAYWHSAPAKVLIDERKSRDLLAAGYAVVRLREDDLPELGIDHPLYREIRVLSHLPRPDAVMTTVRSWVLDEIRPSDVTDAARKSVKATPT